MKITRSELRDLARGVMLANTPASLYQQLSGTLVPNRLSRHVSVLELLDLYNMVTARARRTEIELGLAYAVLIAIIYIDSAAAVDDSIITWGGDIRELAARKPSAQYFVLKPKPMPTSIIKVVS